MPAASTSPAGRAVRRWGLLWALTGTGTLVAAELPIGPADAELPASVAQARAQITADPATSATEMDGWLIVQQPAQNAQWSFTPEGHPAHPAVVRRAIVRGPDGRRVVQTQQRCEGPASACADLAADFARSSDRLQQYLRSRDGAQRPPGLTPLSNGTP